MDIQRNPYLNAASQAIQSGDVATAQRILRRIVAQDPDNVEAWFLLSAVEENHRAVAHCLHNTLALDPRHNGAMNMLAQLEQQTGLEPLQVMQVGPNSAALEQDCPYCSSPFEEEELVVECPKCEGSQHYECWLESGHTCVAVLCDGFSIRELCQEPLPLQPESAEPEMIVVEKSDIPDAAVTTRKQQEQHFQRRLLLMALLAEQGQLPPGQARGLPSVDELLDQIQRDRAEDDRPALPGSPSSAPTALSPLQPLPQMYRSSGVVVGTLSIWPQELEPENNLAERKNQSCKGCGYDFKNSQARFCPKCGAER